jgi:two-component system OmpR family sensor kinase
MYIRTRLALWFLLIMALVLAAFSMAVYQVTRSSLLAQIDVDVRQRAAMLNSAISNYSHKTALRVPKLDVFQAPDIYLQVVDQQGTVLASSGNLGSHRLPLLRNAVAANQVQEVFVGPLKLFLYGQPIRIKNQVVGYVLVARAPQTIYQALNQLSRILLPGTIIALCLAGLAIWLLVRQAMRPLERLATTAAEIAEARDHSRRLHARSHADEISRLARTINEMLQALEDAYQEVQKVNDLQRHFLTDVSHELRAPLTIMLSSLDLIKRVGAADPDFQASSLARMQLEAERMARMVTQLLMLARSDASATAAHEPVVLGDIVVDLCCERQKGAGEPALECRGAELLEGVMVWGNPDYLRQLLLILLDNAFKYTPADGRVEVLADLDGEMVAITVADTGIGIPPGELPRIFERFYRAENARSRSGAGLGLAIARRIAQLHGGDIWVTSELGRGSRFTVRLPLLDEEGGFSERC